jgi:hypothetical protein
VGLKDWDAALESVEMALDAHKLRHFRGRRSKRLSDWRKDAAGVTIREPCEVFVELWTTKAIILEQLGRKDEAAALRKRAAAPAKAHWEDPYTLFHRRLRAWRLKDFAKR